MVRSPIQKDARGFPVLWKKNTWTFRQDWKRRKKVMGSVKKTWGGKETKERGRWGGEAGRHSGRRKRQGRE